MNKSLSYLTFGFGGFWDRYGVIAIIPYWFLAFLTATVAAAPWINRRSRFSLRALLIATTLVAVVLGIITVAAG